MTKREIETEGQTDWSWVIAAALKAERASMSEAVGEAIGVYGNELFDEVEAMIDAKVAKIRDELATMLTTQVAMVLQQNTQLKADADTKMAALRKDLGCDDDGVVRLPNPLRNRKVA